MPSAFPTLGERTEVESTTARKISEESNQFKFHHIKNFVEKSFRASGLQVSETRDIRDTFAILLL